MGLDSARDIVTVVVWSLLVLASTYGFLRSLRLRQLFARTWAWVRCAGERIASFREAGADEVGLLVRVKMQQLKVEMVRWASWAACAIFCTFLPFAIQGRIWREEIFLSLVQDVGLTIAYGMVVLVLLCPGLVTWKTSDIIVGTGMLVCAAYASPWACSTDTMTHAITASKAAALLLSTMWISKLSSILCTTALAIAVVSTILAHGQGIYVFPKLAAAFEVCILILYPVFAYMLDIWIGMGFRSSLEMDVAKEVLSAASALLKTCCDVVVELDQEGRIASPADELGGFLLRGPGRCFWGSRLSDLFSSEEDQRKFAGKLRAEEPSGLGLAEAMHVRIRDGNDELLRLELMRFGFGHPDGSRHHMVGLREFSDFSAEGGRQPRQRQRQCADGASPECSACHQPEDSHGDPQADGDASESEASCGDTTSLEVQVACATVDLTQSGMPVQGFSPGFRARIGRLQLGAGLLDIVRGGDEFQNWAQLCLNIANSGGHMPDRQVTLQMRQGRLRATCRVVLDEEESLDLQHVDLVFFNIRQGRRPRGSPSEAGSGGPSCLKGTPVGRMSL